MSINEKSNDEMILFYGYQSRFSNFHITSQQETFEYKGAICKSSEQAYVLEKSITLKDKETENLIRKVIKEDEKPSSYYKHLSKKIQGDINVWDEIKYEKMVEILKLKFKIPRLNYVLKKTGNKIMVEASHDLFWGSGYKSHEKYAFNPEKWKGKNMLGKALMEVRDFYFGG